MLYSKRPVRFPLEDEILPNKNIIYTNPNGNFANSLGDYYGQDDEVACIMKGSLRTCILRSDGKQKEILNNLTMVYSGKGSSAGAVVGVGRQGSWSGPKLVEGGPCEYYTIRNMTT